MNNALAQTNRDLLHQVSALRETLTGVEIPVVLERYRQSINGICALIEARLAQNLSTLDYGVEAVHTDVLHATASCCRLFDLVNSQLAAAIIRVNERDKLALSVIAWLHGVHASTREKAFGLSSGQFAVYPHKDWPVIYYLPASSQMAVRYLPLLFHEFGHLLYALSKPEMDDLVAEFQRDLKRALTPRAIRDGQTSNDAIRRQVLVAWRDYWTQEVYCDAVGLTIGGASFLHAFSHYFRFRSSEEYFRKQADQLQRRHPVTLLRIQLLVERAERYGLGDAASAVKRDWRKTAALFGVSADFQGTWIDSLSEPLHDVLDDMLEEAQPFVYRNTEAASPLAMIDDAWQSFNAAEGGEYIDVERDSVTTWLRVAATADQSVSGLASRS